LLVDDDAAILAALGRVLTALGHGVVACSSGAEALLALQAQAFDVMLTDIRMPGICGLELLRAVRKHDLDLPVVLITGDPGVSTAADAVEYGAFRYLIKPVPNEELAAVIRHAAHVGMMARSKREYFDEFGSGRFSVADRAGLDALLDRALASLWMAYQPIVRAADSSVVAYEALMRVDEPTLPHPYAVLDAAERTGRIQDIGQAVRKSVAKAAERAREDWLVFVNVHPEELLDPILYLPDSPFTALASRVVLEITERMSLDRVANIKSKIAELRDFGFQIALDDLGAGYAGLTSFTQLEPEFVKLDLSLVRDVHEAPTKQKVIRSMVHLCHDMNKLIVAEGVERIEERDVLVDLGCDLLQGYLFAKPDKPFPEARLP